MVAWTKKAAVKMETRGWIYFRDGADKTLSCESIPGGFLKITQ